MSCKIQQKMVEYLENGLDYLTKEQAEEAMMELKQGERFAKLHQNEVDDNYVSILKYNLACCYQRIGQIDQCLRYLREGIEAIDRKIHQILQRKNLSFVERSLTQPSTLSQDSGIGAPESVISNLLHKYRYLCKFHLQVCAVLSQLNKHDEAFLFGQKSYQYAEVLMEKSNELCSLFVVEIARRKEAFSKMHSKTNRISMSESLEEAHSLSKTQSQFSPYGPIHASQRFLNNDLNSLDLKQEQVPPKINNYFSQERHSSSACNKSQDSQNGTQVSIRRASSADGSLERIHTFNLKLNGQKGEKEISLQQLNLCKANLEIEKDLQKKGSRNEPHLMRSNTSIQSINSNKAYYVEEKTKVLETVIVKVQPVISEFVRIINEFRTVNCLSERQRNQLYKGKKEKAKKQLKISFQEETQINLLKYNHKFKLNVRNILGIKHSDDWIFNLNIGNVMHLSPMNTDELSSKQDRTHELNKDAMLEKIILFVVSYFCLGTELRFLSQKENPTVTKKDSEMWHAKAMHIACLFLPEECPLVSHIINSYKKHHLIPKQELERLRQIEEQSKLLQRQQLAREEQARKESESQANSKDASTAFNSDKNEGEDPIRQIKIKIEKYLENHNQSRINSSKAKKTSKSRQESARESWQLSKRQSSYKQLNVGQEHSQRTTFKPLAYPSQRVSPKETQFANVFSQDKQKRVLMHPSASQRQLAGNAKFPKPSLQQQKSEQEQLHNQLLASEQIQMHYRGRESRNEEQTGIIKYKSLENFPMDEILQDFNKKPYVNKNDLNNRLSNMNSLGNLASQPHKSKDRPSTGVTNNAGATRKLSMNSGYQMKSKGSRVGSPNFNQHQRQPQKLENNEPKDKKDAIMMNCNFNNVNFIHNVNIFEDKGAHSKKGFLQQINSQNQRAPKKSNPNQQSLLSKYILKQ